MASSCIPDPISSLSFWYGIHIRVQTALCLGVCLSALSIITESQPGCATGRTWTVCYDEFIPAQGKLTNSQTLIVTLVVAWATSLHTHLLNHGNSWIWIAVYISSSYSGSPARSYHSRIASSKKSKVINDFIKNTNNKWYSVLCK